MDVSSTTLLAAFSVRGRCYALNATVIHEVIRLAPLTPVRHAPMAVAGIMNLRGKIVTVLDLGLRLGLPAAVPSRDSRILIVENRGEYLGLLVDAVFDVFEVEPQQWEPVPANLSAGEAGLLEGVCRVDRRIVSVLEPDPLLSREA